MGWTQSDWIAYEARKNRLAVNSDGVDDENELHDEIIKHCRKQGWIYFHGSMATRTHRTKGEPDFEIWADGGRKFSIECKKRRGKLSTDQRALIAWAKKLGHTVHVVNSFEEFLKICEK